MARREFPSKVRTQAFQRAAGFCEQCGSKLFPGKFAYDHVLPDALGGEPVLENCEVLCDGCHGAKTAHGDVPRIAKANRQRAAHIGARTKTSRPLPGSKASGWRKRMDGTVERR
ncbi:MAG: HNH endonuclease [Bosea sp.]|nr:HNH endonuclease [Bosea sp. (in: a-proteobacteria)]